MEGNRPDSSSEASLLGSKKQKDISPPISEYETAIETLFTETNLAKIKEAFANRAVNLTTFTRIVTDILELETDYARIKVPRLFFSIDSYQKNSIKFQDLSQYLLCEYELRNSWKINKEKVELKTPARVITPRAHRVQPMRLMEVGNLNLLFSSDGIVSFWSSSFSLRKSKSLRTREIEKEKSYGKLYTDAKAVEGVGKVIVTTGDKEIQFFELPNLEPFCQIAGIPTIAQVMDCKYNSRDELNIVYGDWHGCVTAILIPHASVVLKRWNERQKILGIPSIPFEIAFLRKEMMVSRWKVHDDRVSVVRYTEVMGGQVISCSSDPKTSVVIGTAFPPPLAAFQPSCGINVCCKRPEGEEVSYATPYGIYCLDLWEEKRLFAAGGIDRVIRIWNTLTKSTVAVLPAFYSPIAGVSFYPRFVLLLSISVSYNINLWDLKNFQCVFLITAVTSQIKGLSHLFMHCSRVSEAVVVQTSDELYALSFKKQQVDDETQSSHSTPIVNGAYSEYLEAWITCSVRSVKVWDVRTGKKRFEFLINAKERKKTWELLQEELRIFYEKAIKKRQFEEKPPWKVEKGQKDRTAKGDKYFPDLDDCGHVTCMHVEENGRRLLTGHTSGVIKEYNFFSGIKLRTLYRGMPDREKLANNQINAVLFVKSVKTSNIISVGWDKVVDVYDQEEGVEPISTWDWNANGHKGDIWCATSATPDILATGSYDGLVILWNFTSGSLEARLRPPNFVTDEKSDMSKVTALTFYKKQKTGDKNDRSQVLYLLTAGPGSGLHMWEIYWKLKIFYYKGTIRPWRSLFRFLTRFTPAPTRKLVLAADNLGDVHLFDMKALTTKKGLRYNPRGPEFNLHLEKQLPVMLSSKILPDCGFSHVDMPTHKKSWSAEEGGISALDFSDRFGVILTGGTNGRARVWNFHGNYIGMLGQPRLWEVYDSSTYIHPDIPKEVKQDQRREHEAKLDSICRGEKVHVESGEAAVDNADDYLLSDEQILDAARGLPVYKKKLPSFLKYENNNKIVYKDSLFEQKFSLAPVYRHLMDGDLVKGVKHCG